jgi:alanine dehydrogenase
MLVLNAEDIRSLAPMPELIACLREAFRVGCVAPMRQVSQVPGGTLDRLCVSMPAFSLDGRGVVKLATIFPDNRAIGLPTIHATIIVFSSVGEPIAILDGTTVTQLRTAAASALASTYLSRSDSAHLVVIGTGALAPMLAAAHCAVRPITRIGVCGRSPERILETVATIRSLVRREVCVSASQSTEEAVATADIVTCATSATLPVLAGKWLRAGTFVDLVGSFSPLKREADDEVMKRSLIFVDTLQGALTEAGDIVDPMARGIIDRDHIKGELADLVNMRANGRTTVDEIIMFKSVGTALEDLAAAQMIVAAAKRS